MFLQTGSNVVEKEGAIFQLFSACWHGRHVTNRQKRKKISVRTRATLEECEWQRTFESSGMRWWWRSWRHWVASRVTGLDAEERKENMALYKDQISHGWARKKRKDNVATDWGRTAATLRKRRRMDENWVQVLQLESVSPLKFCSSHRLLSNSFSS